MEQQGSVHPTEHGSDDSRATLRALLTKVAPVSLRLGLDAEQVADALFLASLLPPEAALEDENSADTPKKSTDASPAPGGMQSGGQTRVPPENGQNLTAPRSDGSPGTSGTEEHSNSGTSTEALLGTQQGSSDSSDAGRNYQAFASPSTRAIPNIGKLARSLRPLMRREADPSRQTIAEEQTIDLWAEWGIAQKKQGPQRKAGVPRPIFPAPVLRSGVRLAMEIAFVMDISPTMSLWWENASELAAMLRWQGAFRDVRLYGLDAAGSIAHLVSAPVLNDVASDTRKISVRELRAARGDCIVVVFTDGRGEGWRSGSALDLLYHLGKHQPVAIWHALPESLWGRTAFGNPRWLAHSHLPGVSNDRLTLTPRPGVWNRLRDTPADGNEARWLRPGYLALPILSATDPDLLGAWARMTAGLDSTDVPAIQICLRESHPSRNRSRSLRDENLTPEQRIALFRERASPQARKFATLSAYIPLSPPILRLLFRTFQSKYRLGSNPAIIAELLMSPLVRSVEGRRDFFEFHQGISDLLLSGALAADVIEVLDRLMEEIGNTLENAPETRQTFQAYIERAENEIGNKAVALVTLNNRQRFAHLRALALRKLGLLAPQERPSSKDLPPLPLGITRLLETTLPAAIETLRWTEDGTVLAMIAGKDPRVRIWRESDPGVWLEEPGPPLNDISINCLTWSPDGHSIALCSASSINIYRQDNAGQWRRSAMQRLPSVVSAVDWAPQKSMLAMLHDGRVTIWHSDTSEVSVIDLSPMHEIMAVRWSRSGTLLFFGTHNGAVGWLRPDSNEEPFWIRRRKNESVGGSDFSITALQWAPPTSQYEDGLLATGAADGSITVHELHNGRWSHTLLRYNGDSAHKARITALCFSPSADRMASTDAMGRTHFWRCDTWESTAELNEEFTTPQFAPTIWSRRSILATTSREGRILRLLSVELPKFPWEPKPDMVIDRQVVINRHVCRDAIQAFRRSDAAPNAARVLVVEGPPRSGISFTWEMVRHSLDPGQEQGIYLNLYRDLDQHDPVWGLASHILYTMGADAELYIREWRERSMPMSHMLLRLSDAIEAAAQASGKIWYIALDGSSSGWRPAEMADLIGFLAEAAVRSRSGEAAFRLLLLGSSLSLLPRSLRYRPSVWHEILAVFTREDMRLFFEESCRQNHWAPGIWPNLSDVLEHAVQDVLRDKLPSGEDNRVIATNAARQVEVWHETLMTSPRLFLSGPMRAFAEERLTVLEVAEKLGVSITARENYREETTAQLRGRVADCNLYLAVTTAYSTQALTVGKGGTEIEYHLARHAGRRCLIYLRGEVVSRNTNIQNWGFTPLCELVLNSDENHVVRHFQSLPELKDLLQNDLKQVQSGVWPLPNNYEIKSPNDSTADGNSLSIRDRYEQFCDMTHWQKLEMIGDWKLTSDGVIEASGVAKFLLSQQEYGTKPFTINAKIRFFGYERNNCNAGIVFGWQRETPNHAYYNLLLTGKRILLEEIRDIDRDKFEHLDQGIDFLIEEGRWYEFHIIATEHEITIFINGATVYTTPAPITFLGKIGMRPWRSQLECNYFEIRETLLAAPEVDAVDTLLQTIGIAPDIRGMLLQYVASPHWKTVWSVIDTAIQLFETAVAIVEAATQSGYVQLWIIEDNLLLLKSQQIDSGKTEYSVASWNGVIGRAAKTGRTQWVRDVTVDKSYIGAEPTTLSELVIPLIIPSIQVQLGVINIESQIIEAFDPVQIKWLEGVMLSLSTEIWERRLVPIHPTQTDVKDESSPGDVSYSNLNDIIANIVIPEMPLLREDLHDEMSIWLRRTNALVQELYECKSAHNILHQLSHQVLDPLMKTTADDEITVFVAVLEETIRKTSDLYTHSKFLNNADSSLIRKLEEFRSELMQFQFGNDTRGLREALSDMKRALMAELSNLNRDLVKSAGQIDFSHLFNMLDRLMKVNPLPDRQNFVNTLDSIHMLEAQFRRLVKDHDEWQRVNSDLELLGEDQFSELLVPWQRVKELITPLYESSTDIWAAHLRELSADMDIAVRYSQKEEINIRLFPQLQREVATQFFKVDNDLLSIVNLLRQLIEDLKRSYSIL